ncbi:hypothetical protein PPMP20_37965 [Paraburkholderia phymatum]|uniref:hypothetical protein n=1 Tax=Paraburkholderia phymatum TaxID=148447 RepID=UPI0012FE4557|nr:hypothetical protein [Paraburkholderia phymatum]
MDALLELITWLRLAWIESGRTMEPHEAGRFRDALEQACAELQHHRDDENDRESK